MTKVRNFVEITPNLPFSEYIFYELYRETFEHSELGRMKSAWDGREPRSGEQEYDAQAWTEVLLHPGREGGADVPEDEDADELSEADGRVEREHSLPVVLWHRDWSDASIDELQIVGWHCCGTGLKLEDPGTQKEHYSLRRIKARKKETEILYIFFGIHTANVVQLAERLMEQQLAEAA